MLICSPPTPQLRPISRRNRIHDGRQEKAKGKGKGTVHVNPEETSTGQGTGDGQAHEVFPLLSVLTVIARGGRGPD
jgi:hypothetical protein